MSDGGARIDYEERPDGAGGGRVARLFIDRAAKRNAIGPGVIAGLKSACVELEAVADEGGLRAVVLAGAGGETFAAGADVTVMAGLTPDSARAFIASLHEAIDAVRRLPVPAIAAIRGHCLGAQQSNWRRPAISAPATRQRSSPCRKCGSASPA